MKKIILFLIYFLFLIVDLNATNYKADKINQKLFKKYPWLNQEINNIIVYEARKNNIDPKLVYSIIKYESALFCNNKLNKMLCVKSHANAIGLMQLMPKYHSRNNPELLKNPKINIRKGIAFFKEMIKLSKQRKYSNIIGHALRMYNQGPYGKINKYRNWKNYVFAILNDYTNTENLICIK